MLGRARFKPRDLTVKLTVDGAGFLAVAFYYRQISIDRQALGAYGCGMAKQKQKDEEVDGLAPLEQPHRFFGRASHNGYQRIGAVEDQVFSISPGRQQAWSSIADERQALDALV